jgi:hypothetical protein
MVTAKLVKISGTAQWIAKPAATTPVIPERPTITADWIAHHVVTHTVMVAKIPTPVRKIAQRFAVILSVRPVKMLTTAEWIVRPLVVIQSVKWERTLPIAQVTALQSVETGFVRAKKTIVPVLPTVQRAETLVVIPEKVMKTALGNARRFAAIHPVRVRKILTPVLQIAQQFAEITLARRERITIVVQLIAKPFVPTAL